MSDDSKIEWTDATWNPIRGCSRVSEGCRHCYAERVAARFSGPGQPYHGLVKTARPADDPRGRVGGDPRWNGTVRMVAEHLADPLRWRRPRRVFVNSMSDLFHESLPDSAIDRVFAVMMVSSLHATRGGHTFQSLTKRAKRMREYLTDPGTQERVARAAGTMMEDGDGWFDAIAFRKEGLAHPLIWLGVSVENQAAADERIPELLATPAAVRWISAEPLIGAVDLGLPRTWLVGATARKILRDTGARGAVPAHLQPPPSLDWLVMGAESGTGARAADPAWFRGLAEQCRAAGVPVFFKQGVVGGCVTAGPGSITKRGGLVGLPLLDGVGLKEYPR